MEIRLSSAVSTSRLGAFQPLLDPTEPLDRPQVGVYFSCGPRLKKWEKDVVVVVPIHLNFVFETIVSIYIQFT